MLQIENCVKVSDSVLKDTKISRVVKLGLICRRFEAETGFFFLRTKCQVGYVTTAEFF